MAELCLLRKIFVLDGIHSYITREPPEQKAVEIAAPTAHINDTFAGDLSSLHRTDYHPQDFFVAGAAASPGPQFHLGRDSHRHAIPPRDVAARNSSLNLFICDAGSHNCRAREGPDLPSRRRNSGDSIRRDNAWVRLSASPGFTSNPQDSSTISIAPPIAELMTGNSAHNASTNTIPKGSGPLFGWQKMSAAASSLGTSVRWPRKRTRAAIRSL